jgi:hypothetical protein
MSEDQDTEAPDEPPGKPPRRPVTLPTWGHGGVLPGVDLDDSASLLDLSEREEDPRAEAPSTPSLSTPSRESPGR